MMNKEQEKGEAMRYALHLAAQARGRSNAADTHGGSRKEQLRKRRRDWKKEAKDY